MGSGFTNFHAGCHDPVPLRGLFPQPDLSEPGTREHGIFSPRLLCATAYPRVREAELSAI